MDIKIDGITEEIFDDALKKANTARSVILEKMNEELSEPREELSSKAPQAVIIQINTKRSEMLLEKVERQLERLVEETGAQIDVDDSGKVTVYGDTPESRSMAVERKMPSLKNRRLIRFTLGK